MKIVDIKGTRDYIRFIYENGSFVKGHGELVDGGFYVGENDLILCENETTRVLSAQEIFDLKVEVSELASRNRFFIAFT